MPGGLYARLCYTFLVIHVLCASFKILTVSHTQKLSRLLYGHHSTKCGRPVGHVTVRVCVCVCAAVSRARASGRGVSSSVAVTSPWSATSSATTRYRTAPRRPETGSRWHSLNDSSRNEATSGQSAQRRLRQLSLPIRACSFYVAVQTN